MRFLYYDRTDGRIVAVGENPSEEAIEAQKIDPTLITMLDVEADPETQKIENGEIVFKPGPTIADLNRDALSQMRIKRNNLLADCDWTVLPDSPLSVEKKAEWQNYRKALRDIPASHQSITDVEDVVWPFEPTL